MIPLDIIQPYILIQRIITTSPYLFKHRQKDKSIHQQFVCFLLIQVNIITTLLSLMKDVFQDSNNQKGNQQSVFKEAQKNIRKPPQQKVFSTIQISAIDTVKPKLIKRMNFNKEKKEQSNHSLNKEEKETKAKALEVFLQSLPQDDINLSETMDLGSQFKSQNDGVQQKNLKIQNKLFTNIEIGEQKKIDDRMQYELHYKKEVKAPSKLFEKMTQKISKFKDKMEFKSISASKKQFLSNVHKMSSKQEIEIVVDVPKIMKGSSQVDGAIFLKNAKSNTSLSQPKEDSNKQVNKPRHQIINQMQREIRIKRGETIRVNTECYKKTTLQRLEIKKKKAVQETTFSFIPMKQRLEMLRKKSEEENIQDVKKATLPVSEPCIAVHFGIDLLEPQSEQQIRLLNENQNTFTNNKNQEQKFDEKEQQNQLQKGVGQQKKEKVHRKKKKKKELAQRFIELEAQQSDDEGEVKTKEESSEDQDGDLQGLVDNDYVLNEEDERLAYQKFVQDMKNKEDEEYQRIKSKLEKRKQEAKVALERRINKVNKIQMEEEKQKQEFKRQIIHEFLIEPDEENTNSSVEAFKKLQIQFGIIQKQKYLMGVYKHLKDEKIQENKPLKRPQRNGFRANSGITAFQVKKKLKPQSQKSIFEIDLLHSDKYDIWQ